MSIGMLPPRLPGMGVPQAAVKPAVLTTPQNESFPLGMASQPTDTVKFGSFKKKAGALAAVGLVGVGTVTVGAHQLFTNWGFWWDKGGEKVLTHVINNAIRYPLGKGFIAMARFISGDDVEHYTLNGMRVEGTLSGSAQQQGKIGGYADFVPDPGLSADKANEQMLDNMLKFIQNTPLEHRVYLDPKDEENARTIPDVHERLAVELNMLDGTLQTVEFEGKRHLMLAIQDQTGQRGDYAVYMKEVPLDIATPDTLDQNLEKAKEWSRQAITAYKSVNAEKGGK